MAWYRLARSRVESEAAARRGDDVFTRVLIPTDGGRTAERATETGLEIAARHGASVDALFVVESGEGWDFSIEQNERVGERAVEEIAARAAEIGVPVRKSFRYGTPHEEILEYAADHGVDLVVMGSHGRRGVGRFVHAGSVAERVLRGATVPVLVVRHERRSTER
ncbi:universal stress protein [Halegenticoccus tardaugens]|uniref:universal stress protein n=1 Tax=Halegenticoccus tardaugens TaxID=2071624 RepID=UPI001E3461ED|nr:universal stress protein [Halegenticoccus tardaugens]